LTARNHRTKSLSFDQAQQKTWAKRAAPMRFANTAAGQNPLPPIPTERLLFRVGITRQYFFRLFIPTFISMPAAPALGPAPSGGG